MDEEQEVLSSSTERLCVVGNRASVETHCTSIDAYLALGDGVTMASTPFHPSSCEDMLLESLGHLSLGGIFVWVILHLPLCTRLLVIIIFLA
jgi:hypothetical protein